MPRWKTEDVIKNLLHIEGVLDVTNAGPGGDYDGDNLSIRVINDEDTLFVRPFFSPDYDHDASTSVNPSNDDFPKVEITDGKQSGGGLVSTDLDTGYTYVRLRKYFADKGFEIVDCMDNYF